MVFDMEADTGRIGIGIACGMAAGALWGLVFIAPELAREFTPLQLAAGRYLAYGLVAALLLAPRWAAVTQGLGRAEWWALTWLSLLGNSLYFVLLASAVQRCGVAMTSLVIGFLPVTVTIVGSRDHGAVPLGRLAPSLLLSVLGISCIGWQAIAAPGAGSRIDGLIGLACAFGALASWTTFAVHNSRWLARAGHVSTTDWNLLTGVVTGAQALLLVIPAMLIGARSHEAAEWLRFGAVVSGIAIAASILGNALWNRMSRLLPLTLVGQMILFETLFALLYGFLWEKRWPTGPEVAAMAMVTASVVLCISAHRPRRGDPAPAAA
ncbi:DMT family transporter [Edaphosphingomonas haloaromaticamans]|uniref:Inner membrane protein YtfF n=1 Tax=Edaphosphingomonas haloaromaticamans TaxID=653954 RepID=A0A1S1HPJ2_9SPHN|nr:DMT family transporter [Sphingomonas haloaromaticamans]OHT22280.1 Inner membrane protein YtfF [Sphingomonas haloaromaticamans]